METVPVPAEDPEDPGQERRSARQQVAGRQSDAPVSEIRAGSRLTMWITMVGVAGSIITPISVAIIEKL